MATKRRSMPVTFNALIEWQRGVFAAMSEKNIPAVPGMLLAIAVMRNGGTVGQLAQILATGHQDCVQSPAECQGSWMGDA